MTDQPNHQNHVLVCSGCGKPFGPKLGAKLEIQDGRPVLSVGASNGHEFAILMSWEAFAHFAQDVLAALVHAPSGIVPGLEVTFTPDGGEADLKMPATVVMPFPPPSGDVH